MMKAVSPKPVHASYQRHRRQVTSQIILPVVLAAGVFLSVVILLVSVTFALNAVDPSRWAAVSTIWILIPILLVGLLFLGILVGLIYGLARLLGIAPTYTNMVQNFVEKLGRRIRKAADIPVKPIFFLDGIGATLKALFGRK